MSGLSALPSALPKDIAGDYMAGFLIHFTHPFRTGDIIKTGDFFGYVDAMELRVTRCRTQQGQRVIIPNRKILDGEIVNYTISGCAGWIYPLPSIGRKICRGSKNSASRRWNLWKSPCACRRQVEFFYEKFDGTNINFSLRFWTKPEQQTYLKATSEAIKAVGQAFKENKVEMVSSTIALDFGMPGVHSLRRQLEGVTRGSRRRVKSRRKVKKRKKKKKGRKRQEKRIRRRTKKKRIELDGEVQVKTPVLIILNLVMVGLFLFLFTRWRRLTYHQDRQLWLTWLSVAIITLMDEFTEVFFAPADAMATALM